MRARRIKNCIMCLLVFAFLIFGEYVNAANAKIGKVNVALLAAMHPKMSLFDFTAMGFYRVELGMTQQERNEAVKKYMHSEEYKQKLNLEIDAIDKEIYELVKETGNLVAKQSELNAEKKTEAYEENEKKLKAIREKTNELKRDRKERLYALKYPQFTSPYETRDILAQIEKETMESINEVFKEEGYDVVLNTYVPVPFGYPYSYSKKADFYHGPLWITQSVYFAIMCGGYKSKAQAREYLFEFSDYIKRICRPDTQKYLPMSPRPVVLKGGEDIMIKCLAKLYKKYNIGSEVFAVVAGFFEKFNQEN